MCWGAFVGEQGEAMELVFKLYPWEWQPMVYQELHPEVVFEGAHPVLGSWVIGGEAAGIGVREDRGRITSNGSRFVPQLF